MTMEVTRAEISLPLDGGILVSANATPKEVLATWRKEFESDLDVLGRLLPITPALGNRFHDYPNSLGMMDIPMGIWRVNRKLDIEGFSKWRLTRTGRDHLGDLRRCYEPLGLNDREILQLMEESSRFKVSKDELVEATLPFYWGVRLLGYNHKRDLTA